VPINPVLPLIIIFLIAILFIVGGVNILCNSFVNQITKNPSKISRIGGMFFGFLFMILGVGGIVALMCALEK